MAREGNSILAIVGIIFMLVTTIGTTYVYWFIPQSNPLFVGVIALGMTIFIVFAWFTVWVAGTTKDIG